MNQNPKRIMLKNEVYSIPTPRSLIIGDPMYLEQIELGKNRLKKFCVLLKRIPIKLQTELVWKVSKLEYEPDNLFPNGLTMMEYNAFINMGTEQKFLDTFRKESFYPALKSYEHELGCDNARFDIMVNNQRMEEIHTGADGYYGFHLAYKGGQGHMISFNFPEDLMTEKEMRKTLAYLFLCPDILKED